MEHNENVELPHGASVNSTTNIVTIRLGNVDLKFSIEEWSAFCEIIDDVNLALQSGLVNYSFACETCGSHNVMMRYEETSDEEIN